MTVSTIFLILAFSFPNRKNTFCFLLYRQIHFCSFNTLFSLNNTIWVTWMNLIIRSKLHLKIFVRKQKYDFLRRNEKKSNRGKRGHFEGMGNSRRKKDEHDKYCKHKNKNNNIKTMNICIKRTPPKPELTSGGSEGSVVFASYKQPFKLPIFRCSNIRG